MKLIRLIALPVLMYILAGLYALILAVATLVENSYGPAVAREFFYYAPWFILLQLLQAVNLLAMFLQGSYFKRISKGSLIFHGAFLFIWLGAAVTHYVGVTGIMHIREGETANSMMKEEGTGMENASHRGSGHDRNLYLFCYHRPDCSVSDTCDLINSWTFFGRLVSFH